jgi:MFS superfamily sulfate permease-like transporter
LAPQVGSVFLLFFFYLTNFRLVGFIPKTAFSSLLLLAFIDMMSSWFIKSFLTTKEKMEWLVVPLIIALAFTLNLLQAVFLGIAMSTFLFVASFNRSGVVKYVANGQTIRSTIERPPRVARWLGQSANQIQILILQNYLFFGNASSILSYVTTMFEEPDRNIDRDLFPPIPKIIILDLTLVTGKAAVQLPF